MLPKMICYLDSVSPPGVMEDRGDGGIGVMEG